ncbi:MAG: MerR family transcriptional regulator [Actinomycetota bacterium]|nr:MerR family transcriptional regulator [Actinomycetota bacterium]MDA2970911.1 MerR family transcriptional regulator [Actinomycetota bacterium]MDA3000103.1 MerR family transcriptional regulator [Actinomycetota bacterium]
MSQRSTAERPYLSIGEVLGLLLEEFPDITISKIRFLESQGLIVPERTPSGYRKFYDDDVERLKFILREQKENFLPLRVIKDRLDTPPSGTARPEELSSPSATEEESASPAPVASHPSRRNVRPDVIVDKAPRRPAPPDPSDSIGRPATYTRAEILEMSGLDPSRFVELETFGLVGAVDGKSRRSPDLFDEHDLAIAEVAAGFLEAGVDIRHLKAWRIAADREAGLLEQRVLPVLRRRTPDARAEANELLDELSDLGGRLRAILVARGVGTLREPRSESR